MMDRTKPAFAFPRESKHDERMAPLPAEADRQ